MKILKCLTAIIMIFSAGYNITSAQDYICQYEGFSGYFNPDKKPNTKKCDYLKDYTLSYDSCMASLKSDIDKYELCTRAYQNGYCSIPKTKTMKYGNAVCTAQYPENDKISFFSMNASGGSDSDRNECMKLLSEQIYNIHPNWKIHRRIGDFNE